MRMHHLKLTARRRSSRERTVPEVVYEGLGNQFDLDDVSNLEHWLLEMTCEQGGGTLAKLRNGFSDQMNIKVRYHVIRKALMRLGYRWGSAEKLVRLTRITTNLMAIQSAI